MEYYKQLSCDNFNNNKKNNNNNYINNNNEIYL